MTKDFNPNKAVSHRTNLSKEDFAEKKRAEKERVYNLIDDTALDVMSSPEKFKAYFDTQSRMDRYSAVNALLIYSQLPKATQLKDFDDWSKDNVKIVKGAKSISIFEPVEVQSVDELPYPNTGAFYNNEKQTLFVKKAVGDSVVVAQCVAQELAHAQLSINSDTYSRRDMGFQAVCIGYMICKKHGIDTQNFAIERIPDEYKNMNAKEVRAFLSKTRNAMSDIQSSISEQLYRSKQIRSKEQAR